MNNLDIAMLVAVGVVTAVVAAVLVRLTLKLAVYITRNCLKAVGYSLEEENLLKVAAILVVFAIYAWVTAGSFVQIALSNMP